MTGLKKKKGGLRMIGSAKGAVSVRTSSPGIGGKQSGKLKRKRGEQKGVGLQLESVGRAEVEREATPGLNLRQSGSNLFAKGGRKNRKTSEEGVTKGKILRRGGERDG